MFYQMFILNRHLQICFSTADNKWYTVEKWSNIKTTRSSNFDLTDLVVSIVVIILFYPRRGDVVVVNQWYDVMYLVVM